MVGSALGSSTEQSLKMVQGKQHSFDVGKLLWTTVLGALPGLEGRFAPVEKQCGTKLGGGKLNNIAVPSVIKLAVEKASQVTFSTGLLGKQIGEPMSVKLNESLHNLLGGGSGQSQTQQPIDSGRIVGRKPASQLQK